MNKVGLEKYLKYEAFDDELMRLAEMYGEDNRYDNFRVFNSLKEYVNVVMPYATGAEVADLAQQIDTGCDLFRVDGKGEIEGISQAEYIDEIKKYYLDEIVNWCGNASGFYYRILGDTVTDLIDQDDPLELLDSISFSYEYLGSDNYAVTLTCEDRSATFPYHASDGTLNKVDLIDCILYDMNTLVEDYNGTLPEYAEFSGLDYSEPDEREQAEALYNGVVEGYKKLAVLVFDYNQDEDPFAVYDDGDFDFLSQFLVDVKRGEYKDLSWESLKNRPDASSDIKQIAGYGVVAANDAQATQKEHRDLSAR